MSDNFDKVIAIGPKVLIEEEKVNPITKGGIALPPEVVDKNQMGQTSGKLVQKGKMAFEYLSEEERPPIGAIVHFVKYAGVGKYINDKFFRILNDEDIYGYEPLDEA